MKTITLILLFWLSFYDSLLTPEKTIMDSVTVNGINLHYTVTGQGNPLLLLHGWTQTHHFWDSYLNALSKNYTVFSLDLRGHGETGILKSDFKVQEAATDVEEFIKKLKLKNVKAMGLSYGGLLLLENAIKEGSTIKEMVLIGVTDQFNGMENQDDQQRFEFENLDKSFQDQLLSEHTYGMEQIDQFFNPNLDFSISISEDQLRSISSKILLINGERDEMVGTEGVERIHKYVPNSELWIVPYNGHIPITGNNREEFLRIVNEFFARDYR